MKPRILALLALAIAGQARGDALLPAWNDPNDIPLPTWAKSVAPKRAEVPILMAPGATDQRRGTIAMGARLPLFGAKRAGDCGGRWLQVGAAAWVCSDAVDVSPDEPSSPVRTTSASLPYRYYFVGKNGADGYVDLSRVADAAPDEQLDPGFAVAVMEERTVGSDTWLRTRHGTWIAAKDLVLSRPSGFHGETRTSLDFAWVIPDRISVYSAPKIGDKKGSRVRFEVVPWLEERATTGGAMVRISADGVLPAEWVERKSLAHPITQTPPPGLRDSERWIDIDLASQTLVALDGTQPVFATLVSTGRGAQGTDAATPKGVYRIWVKLETTNMDNLESEDAEKRYSMEDVPYVQFFERGVGLHAAFWHNDFGKVRSHGCVNLSPSDAKTLFDFTGPRMPAGWSAVIPNAFERGTLVRVR